MTTQDTPCGHTTAGWESATPAPADYPFHEIPRGERTVAVLWRRALRWGADRPFVSFEGGGYHSLADVDRLARRWSAVLRALGLAHGDRVAVMLPNSAEHLAIFLGAVNTSLVVVPVNLAHRGEMLRHVLVDSGSKVLVSVPECAARITGWELPALSHVVLVSDDGDLPVIPGVAVSRSRELATRTSTEDSSGPGPDDVAAVLYTSGTTGPAKGALVTHQYLAYFSWGFAHTHDDTAEDVLFTVLPMFHVNPYVCTLIPAMMTGARAVVYNQFRASRFWHQIADTGATHFVGMGSMGNILMRRPASEYRGDHRLRMCQVVPAPDDLPAFEKRFRVPVVYAMYGMTEGLMVLPSRDGSDRPGLIGRLHPYHQIAVLDDDDQEVAVGVAGELAVRPLLPGIMFTGYLGRPEATVEALRNLWFHTGDLGSRDEHGDLWFLGRKKDAIRRRGENVSAFDVEREVLRFATVAEAAAIGVAAELGEEEVLLCVVAQPGATIDPAALHAFCVASLPAFMVPRYIDIRDELPKNQSQRVLKRDLRSEGLRTGVWEVLSDAVRGSSE